MLESACDESVTLACAVGASWLGDPKNADALEGGQDVRARFEIKLACLSGQSDACYQIGLAFYEGRDSFPRDRKRAVQAYGRACDLGDSSACNNLGDALAYGEGASRDVERAAAFFDKSCHLGVPLGCANLGYMLEHGEGVGRDLARAGALYRDACMSGEVYGCLHAELLAAEAHGAPVEPSRALAHWSAACERQRSAQGCAFLGLLYEDGPDGLARDEAKSRVAMKRACALGSSYACQWAKFHVED
jgi:TPR repeat protein